MHELRRTGQSLLQRRRTVVASADRVLITGLTSLYDDIGPLVGAATSEAEALACVRSHPTDLLICTDLLDAGSGPSLVAAAKAARPTLACLMLIQRPLRSTLQAAIAAGCNGLCSRDRVGNGHLLRAVQAIESDEIYIDPLISGVLRHCRLSHSAGPSPLQEDLTLREEDVLRGICRGLTNQEIADQLHLSIDTVKHIGSAILRKLDARDRSQAMLIAFRHDLVDLPTEIPRWRS